MRPQFSLSDGRPKATFPQLKPMLMKSMNSPWDSTRRNVSGNPIWRRDAETPAKSLVHHPQKSVENDHIKMEGSGPVPLPRKFMTGSFPGIMQPMKAVA